MQRAEVARQRQENLDSYRAGGLSVTQWCKQTGVSRSTMYRWLREEATSKVVDTEPSIIEKNQEIQSKGTSTVSWLPVTQKGGTSINECNVSDKSQMLLKEEIAVENIQVQIGNFTIITPNGFGRQTFKSVCEVLLDIC